MPQKKEELPVKVDVDLQNGGTISYANEVIATIAGVAANEIDGIAGMCVSGGFGEILGRNKNITRGVKVEVGSQEAAVDLYIIVEYGKPIQKLCAEVQENVRKALESLTGLHVVRVDVHVQGVSFEKEKKANQNSLEASKSLVLAAPEKEPVPEVSSPAPEKGPQPAEASAPQEAALETREEAPGDPGADEGAKEQPAPAPQEPEAAAAPEEAPAKPPRRKKAPPAGEEPEGDVPAKPLRGRKRA